MTPHDRDRLLVAWAHFYFLLTFRWWYETRPSFSAEGLVTTNTLPVWGLDWMLRLPEPALSVFLEGLILLSLVGMGTALSPRGLERSRRLLWLLLAAKLYLYSLDLRLFTTYHHMHLLMAALLALGTSRFWLQIALAQIYFFSALGKFNDSWLGGDYFQSIAGGLPLLGGSPVVLLLCSWAVIVLELIGPVCWFLPSTRLRRVSLYGFLIFHLYSGFIVGFRYPLLMLPLWYLVLWPLETPVQKSLQWRRRDLPGAVLLLVTFLTGWWPYVIPSDARYTAEGRYFSIGNMFDANRTTRFEVRFQKAGSNYTLQVNRTLPRQGFYDASTEVLLSENDGPFRFLTGPLRVGEAVINPSYFQEAHLRLVGDPYLYLYFLKRLQADQLNATLRVALNGGKDVRVFQVDEELPAFRPGARNEWVHDE